MAEMDIKLEQKEISPFFTRDHTRLDTLFQNFLKKKDQHFSEAKSHFKDFVHGLQRHIVWEEDVLFPVFEQKTGMTAGGPTAVMRSEHRKIKEILERLHEEVRQGNAAVEAIAEHLMSALSIHNQKEEHVLYPSLDEMLNEQEVKTIFQKMENIPEERYKHCCK